MTIKTTTVIIFDVNETLLDLEPLKQSVGKVLNDNDQLTSLWFTTMLQYSLVHTIIGDYQSFGQIGVAALIMVAKNNGIEVRDDLAQEAITQTMTQLPAHSDVISAISRFKKAGFKVVCLTNSSKSGVKAQLEFAGLTELFEKCFSVEDVKAFKPSAIVYKKILQELVIKPAEGLMVAAHPWDLAGANKVGLQTAFIQRVGTSFYPNIQKPDYSVKDLNVLVDLLVKDEL